MSDIAEDELYEMVNLPPRLTGLPMTVCTRPHGAGEVSAGRRSFPQTGARLRRSTLRYPLV